MLLWADPFDQYAGDEAAADDGPYANLGSGWTFSQTKPRTGGWSARASSADIDSGDTTNNSNGSFRRVFGGPKVTAGAGYAMWIEQLPAFEVGSWTIPTTGVVATKLFGFLDATGLMQVMISLGTDGAVVAYRGYNFDLNGAGWTLLGRSAPCIRTQSYNHVEAKVTIDNTNGAVEVRVNGVTVLNLTGVDTQKSGNAETSQLYVYKGSSLSDYGAFYIDDLFAWDDQGSYNNDFIGDQKVYYLAPNADTAQADWTPSSGATSYTVVDESPPDDTDYLSIAATTGKTNLGLANLPAAVVAVAGVIPLMRAWKTDAGVCDISPGVVQGATYSTPNGQAITTAPQYWQNVVETDPVSGVPFTPADVNSLDLVLERTA